MRLVRTFLGISVLCLLAWGIVVLASAGGENGFRLYSDNSYFITRQLMWLGIALPCFFAASKFDYHKWRDLPWLMWGVYGIILLMMVAVFFFPKINGSRRWVVMGPLRIQPSEFAKIVSILITAVLIDKSGWAIGKFWRGVMKTVMFPGILIALALGEPDFGAALVISVAASMVFLVGGMWWIHIGEMILIGGVGIGTLVALNPNRMNRIFSWMKDSWITSLFGDFLSKGDGANMVMSAKELAAAHQADMALVAIRNGGATGVGLNKSMQKLRYLPEAHTDFIFAIGAEEWGLIFSLSILILFTVFFVCGMIIASRAPDRFGKMIAYGITILIYFQVLFNVGVVTKLLPTKGLALPFISYGGTNLLAALIEVGILFNIGSQIGLPKSRPRSTI